MYNVIKYFLPLLVAAALMTGCSGTDSRTEQAQALLEQARASVARKDYAAAVTALDTLDKKYRDCTALRREGTILRTEALRDLTLDSISANDARLTELQRAVDAGASRFRRVDVAGTEGYYVLASEQKSWNLNKTGIQPRIEPDGYFYIAVNLNGRTIGLNALSAGGVRSGAGSSVAVEGSEVMNLRQEQAQPFVEALAGGGAPVKVTLCGTRGNLPLTLDRKAVDAIGETWSYALARQELRLKLIQRERLERQLARLRDALANLPAEADGAPGAEQ